MTDHAAPSSPSPSPSTPPRSPAAAQQPFSQSPGTRLQDVQPLAPTSPSDLTSFDGHDVLAMMRTRNWSELRQRAQQQADAPAPAQNDADPEQTNEVLEDAAVNLAQPAIVEPSDQLPVANPTPSQEAPQGTLASGPLPRDHLLLLVPPLPDIPDHQEGGYVFTIYSGMDGAMRPYTWLTSYGYYGHSNKRNKPSPRGQLKVSLSLAGTRRRLLCWLTLISAVHDNLMLSGVCTSVWLLLIAASMIQILIMCSIALATMA
ncbi:hypothetical protein HJFPF1_09219 [Paramyrothecium foliicola]|nr:hypothetical protein HJFPF1_09219 [Paramyrothecium foliicola]